MSLELEISLYRSAKDNKGNVITIQQFIDMLTSSEQMKKIDRLREATAELDYLKEKHKAVREDKKEWKRLTGTQQNIVDNLKKELQAVTFAGTFSKRNKDLKFLLSYTYLLTIDIDKIPNPDALYKLKENLKEDIYTFLLFTSPGGKGLKVIVKIEGDPQTHINSFYALEKYYNDKYGVQIDPSGKDISRLCFCSYDNDFRCNPGSTVYVDKLDGPYVAAITEDQKRSANLTANESQELISATDNDLDWIKKFTDNKITYTEGNRNNYVYLFACNCNRKGIDINDCLTYLSSLATDLQIKDVAASVQSAYTHNALEFAKYKKTFSNDNNTNRRTKSRVHRSGNSRVRNNADSSNNVDHNNDQSSEGHFNPFWYYSTKKEGEKEIRNYSIKYNELVEFLADAGFYRLPLKEGTAGYQFIHFTNNICKPVTHLNMKDYVFDWLLEKHRERYRDQKFEATDPDKWEFRSVLEMMRRGAKSYFIPQVLEGLPYKQIEFKRDTSTEAFFYFKNCFAKVTAKNITTHDYTELQGAIWASSMIEKEFTINKAIDYTNRTDDQNIDDLLSCEFYRFLLLVSHNHKNENPQSTDDEKNKLLELHNEKYKAIATAIGYLLHGYKTPSNAKAVVAVDHAIADDKDEQNGGTGKSIIGNYALKSMKKIATISGKEFKDENPWKYEPVTIDSQIVFFNDVRRNFNFENVFEIITDDMVINRRNIGYLTIPFNQSPKVYITTNSVMRGDGSSFKRRIHTIEFDNYFNEEHTPYDEFNHNLFLDWDTDQWNRFYNLMLQCVQWYLCDGMVVYPGSNYDQRKLIAECPQEFLDWMDGQDETTGKYLVARNARHSKKELMKAYNEHASDYGLQKPTAHMFSKWVKKYCKTKGFMLNPHKEGRSDKSNGIEYYTISDKNWKGTHEVVIRELFAKA